MFLINALQEQKYMNEVISFASGMQALPDR